ncbi:hypothetical protein EXIGLDRAFT_796577 [Exidia glandulosa HHB12029]|uniref:DUF6532 domain-containing protein n=1 Tax=Exidia glandulosa HHB12029 TaxID=1314781 RepID=A0A165FKQ8_EXIGL|nr:hypothetical protein EXIGLDRAFT_796577 [Exidia glandulosa HHB12029]
MPPQRRKKADTATTKGPAAKKPKTHPSYLTQRQRGDARANNGPSDTETPAAPSKGTGSARGNSSTSRQASGTGRQGKAAADSQVALPGEDIPSDGDDNVPRGRIPQQQQPDGSDGAALAPASHGGRTPPAQQLPGQRGLSFAVQHLQTAPPASPVSQFASWANTGPFGSATADGTSLVDKTQESQIHKRKASALNDPGSKAQLALVAKLRAHAAGGSGSNAAAAAAGPLAAQAQPLLLPPPPSSNHVSPVTTPRSLISFDNSPVIPLHGALPSLPAPSSFQWTPDNGLGLQLDSASPAPPPFQPLPLPAGVMLIQPGLAPGRDAAVAQRNCYDHNTQTYIDAALSYVQARILVVYGFPQALKLRQFNEAAWFDARALTQTWYSLIDPIRVYLTHSVASFRSRFKNAILAHVKTAYGLHALNTVEQAARASQLLSGDVFVYRDWITRPTSSVSSTSTAIQEQSAVPSDPTLRAKLKNFTEKLTGKGRAFAHPAILGVIKIVAFEKGTRSKGRSLVALMPTAFENGIPAPFYAFAATAIHHALDTVVAYGKAPEFSESNYYGKYKMWHETAESKFLSEDPRMAELRADDWADVRATFGNHIVHESRHDDAVGTDDED